MKTDTLFYCLFQRAPKLALELLGLNYDGDSYCFSSEELKQTAFRIDGLLKSREEIKKMLALNEVELRQTRFYQEVSAEGRQEGKQEGLQEGKQVGLKVGKQEECILLLSRLLRRKFGLQPQLENSLQELPRLPLEKLEDLADALLDFNVVSDLETWLANHS